MNELIQIQKNGKVAFDSILEVAPAAGGCGSGGNSGCGGGCGCGDKPSTPAPANFIPLEAVSKHNQLEVADLREELSGKSGPEYWRSLNEVTQKPGFEEMMAREFPGGAPASWQGVSRRDFLRLMGASLALAGLAGCVKQPEERIVPYVKQPEDVVPGRALYFASAMPRNGYARGVLVESHMGRPTKIEGNPDHPSSLGKADVVTQAALLSLYDPDRSQAVTRNGEKSSFESFADVVRELIAQQRPKRGAGLRILTETVTSPTLAAQMQQLLTALPEARWHAWEPAGRDNAREGARLAFGRDANTVYRFDRADVIVSLDSNFLMDDPGSVRYAREFSDGRRVRSRTGQTRMNRLYAFESTPAITGANADHRWAVKASEVAAIAGNLLRRQYAEFLSGSGDITAAALPAAVTDEEISAVVADLKSARGRSLVIAGDNQPPEVHALALAINQQLGNIGQTVLVTEPIEATPANTLASLQNLTRDMNAGTVDAVIVIGSNPVYSAPADLNFQEAFKKVPLRIRLGLYDDETSNWCHWHVPQSHFLEEWSDLRAHDGTASIVQPLITPLYQSAISAHQLLALLLGRDSRDGYSIVREYWSPRAAGLGGADFETWWRRALNDGVIAGTAASAAAGSTVSAPAASPQAPATGIEITFHPDPYIWDGRDANNGWLQELPRPMTKITWDNAALISVNTARELNLNNYEMVKVSVGGRSMELPIWITPGQPDNSVAVHLGFGRTRSGKIAEGAGFNAYEIRSSDSLWIANGGQVEKMNGRLFTLAVTQEHHTLDTRIPSSPASDQKRGENGDTMDSFHGRKIIKVLPIAQFRENPNILREREHEAHGHALDDSGHGGPVKEGQPGPPVVKPYDYPNLMPSVWPSDRRGIDENGVPIYDPAPKGYNGNPVPQWAMTIDLTTCIGCNACTMACQAENNIPIVGKEEVVRGREMHWIRVDRYYKGDVNNPESYHQPVACMHCEKAPCEPVCPVAATSHSSEGINEMTYNRCVGTKYCSNNCPYKVRRFNFLQYSEQDNPTITMMKNPDVTVRSRGVMEKCTFCIQRINDVRWRAEKDGTTIGDDDLQTACQQTCPTNAIIFGNIADRKSEVYESKAEPHNYGLLTELNTFPRTTYLAKLRNPNPALEKAAPEAKH